MPLFFFDIYDNGTLASDEFGVELDSVQEAREQAIALLPDMARTRLPDSEHHEFKAVVRSQDSRVLYLARLIYQGEWKGLPEDDSSGPTETHVLVIRPMSEKVEP